MNDSIRTHPRITGRTWLAAIVGLLALLAVAACGTATAQTNVTPSPSAAAILQQASAASFTDISFTLTRATTAQGQTVTSTGTGKATKSPQRTETSLTTPTTVNGKTVQVLVETISDTATKTVYTRKTTNGVAGKWIKSTLGSSSSSSSVDVSALMSFDAYQNATLTGAETMDGVAIWHLQASPASAAAPASTATTQTPTAKTPTVSAASATKTAVASATQTAITSGSMVDIYIRKDNSQLVKVTSHVPGSSGADVTLTVTHYNSGVTIDLPK